MRHAYLFHEIILGMRPNHRWRPFNLIGEAPGSAYSQNYGRNYGLSFKDLDSEKERSSRETGMFKEPVNLFQFN